MDDIAIKISNIKKSFKLPHEKQSSLKSSVLNIFSKKSYEKQNVLKGIDFEIEKGDFFGIVGRNGSGKSTLLKLLAGVYSPDEGAIVVNGKLTPFIELGVGFNPELSGRENVFLNGALLGFSQKEMVAMYDEIVEFAELGRFMDQKLKNYSSGMQVRLAFSIAIRANSDILLIDEVLAVGDVNFQKKCIEVFRDLKTRGKTVVFVTHSMEYVREFCNKIAVMTDGRIVHIGEVEKGIDLYNKLNYEAEVQNLPKNKSSIERFGSGEAEIIEYDFYDKARKRTTKLQAGEEFTAKVRIIFKAPVLKPAIGIMFRKDKSVNLFGINSHFNKIHINQKNKGDELLVDIKGVMPLAKGDYYVSFSVADAESATTYKEVDMLNNVMSVHVIGEERWGVIEYTPRMEVHNV